VGDEDGNTAGDGSGGDGGSNGVYRRSRGERRAFADLVFSWAAAIASHRDVLESWESFLGNLRAAGRSLDGDDRSSAIVEILRTIKIMRDAEKLSSKTRRTLEDIITGLRETP
jgi:hypothetical protein